MRIAILHNAIEESAAKDEADVLVQVQAVHGALEALGHESVAIPVDLDLSLLSDTLSAEPWDLVFNLVEGLGGSGRLIHVVPGLLDTLSIPYTGCSAEAQFLTSNKILAKERLRAFGLPTPAWIHRFGVRTGADDPPTDPSKYIVKSIWEHASVGLGDDAIVSGADLAALDARIEERALTLGGECFAEMFIDGRELNLALLAGPDGPEVLPPAEIAFIDFPEHKPKIVGYAAKWEESSFEYLHTARRFEFPDDDDHLLEELTALSKTCWSAFRLTGFARVDFRVDRAGRPWILEVNANPCLSPDAGFAAALDRAGIAYRDAVDRLITDALERQRSHLMLGQRRQDAKARSGPSAT